jgi:hypothetical protein
MSDACYDPLLVGSMEYILSVDIVTKESWHVNSHGILITFSLLQNGGPVDIYKHTSLLFQSSNMKFRIATLLGSCSFYSKLEELLNFERRLEVTVSEHFHHFFQVFTPSIVLIYAIVL